MFSLRYRTMGLITRSDNYVVYIVTIIPVSKNQFPEGSQIIESSQHKITVLFIPISANLFLTSRFAEESNTPGTTRQETANLRRFAA